jgi:hypothetical protein
LQAWPRQDLGCKDLGNRPRRVAIGGGRDDFGLFDEQMPEAPDDFQPGGNRPASPGGLRLKRRRRRDHRHAKTLRGVVGDRNAHVS